MRFERDSGMPRGSYSNVSEFLFTCIGLESPVGLGMKFKFGKNRVGAKVLKPMRNTSQGTLMGAAGFEL
jgi:hypothetical protein